MSRTYPWHLTDAFWERAQPLIAPRPAKPKGSERRYPLCCSLWPGRFRQRLIVRFAQKQRGNFGRFTHVLFLRLLVQ
jgi:hypothetical protein